MKSAGSEDFKTDLTFDIWPTGIWDIGSRTHQGSFSFFTWIWKVSAVVTNLLDLQNLNLKSSITFSDIFHTNYPGFNPKILKILIFKSSLLKLFRKLLKLTWKCGNWKRPLLCSNTNISASTWPNIKSKVSFVILRTSRFQKWPYFLNLAKISFRYWPKTVF